MTPKYLVGMEGPVKRLAKTFPSKIDETLVLGLDIGIGSCGQAFVSLERPHTEALGSLPAFFTEGDGSFIRYMGVRAFDVPESPDPTGGIKLKNPERRGNRLLRRAIRRRAHRMIRARNLLRREGLLPAEYSIHNPDWRQKHEHSTPWIWRAEGLTRRLTEWEWAASLLHIAKHRGFKSNKKSDFNSKGSEGGTLQSVRANQEALKNHRSVSELMLNDPRFAERIRNRAGSYQSTVLREDLEREIKALFEEQRKYGNPFTSDTLEEAFLEVFRYQNPLQDPYALLGDCPFEKGNKRGSRFSFSFELSRALQKLNTLTLILPDGAKVYLREFVCAEAGGYDEFIANFGKSKGVTWKDLRTLFRLSDSIKFLDLPVKSRAVKKGRLGIAPSRSSDNMRKSAEADDFVTRSTSKACAEGSWSLRRVLGEELWGELIKKDVASLDNAAFCLTFFESPHTILEVSRGRQHCYPVDKRIAEAIENDFEKDSPSLLRFEGSVSLSMEASRKLLPHLAKGLVYSDACTKAGYIHTERDYAFKNISNPIVSSVLREVMKQVVHIIDIAGVIPGSICVELGRDLGKSIVERNETALGIRRRTEERNEHRKEVAELLGRNPEAIDSEMLLRYELWLQQSGLCPYCGESLPLPKECISGSKTQIDHVIPRSRSHDNSFNNKLIVHTSCNQQKASRTPAEWLGAAQDTEKWRLFLATVQQMPRMKQFKKRQYLLNESFGDPDVAASFCSRNLNDTRYISRLVLEYLKDIYRIAGEDPEKKGSKRRVFAQPGALTSLVRRAWGLESLKHDRHGSRIDDRHHAIDALICACLSEGQRQWITRNEQGRVREGQRMAFASIFDNLSQAYREMEARHESRLIPPGVSAPWDGFRSDVMLALGKVNVSRREKRKGRGQLHQETFYRMERDADGQAVYYSRKDILQLDKGKIIPLLSSINDIQDVKGVDEPKNQWLKQALTDWIDRGAPLEEHELPRNPNGAIIRKVTKKIGSRAGRPTPHGYVLGGKQVCIDVFSKVKSHGKRTITSSSFGGEQKIYFLVPIYSYELREDNPPMRAITAHKPEEDWVAIDETYTYEFTLWPNSLFEVKKKPTKGKPEGEYMRGYYRGVDRGTGKIGGRALNDAKTEFSCSVKQGSLFFNKLNIDRLGRITRVKGEKRVWRGKVCT